jgi:hypothetical protein
MYFQSVSKKIQNKSVFSVKQVMYYSLMSFQSVSKKIQNKSVFSVKQDMYFSDCAYSVVLNVFLKKYKINVFFP